MSETFRSTIVQTGKTACGILNPLDGLNSSAEISASFPQLNVKLCGRRLVPQLNFAQRRFVDHAQPCGQRTHQTVRKLRLGQLERIGHAKVLAMAALNEFKIPQVAAHVRLFGCL